MKYHVLPVLLVALAVLAFASAPLLAADKAKENTHEGKVVSVTGNKLVMVDKSGKNEHTHVIATDAKVTCNGKACLLSDLKPGMVIKVTTAKGGKEVVRIDARKGKGTSK